MISPDGILDLGIDSWMPFGIVDLHAYTLVIVLVILLLLGPKESGACVINSV